MAIPPLPGPAGLYNVSTAPQFLRDSGLVGWQGAFFTTLVAAHEGRIEQRHERYCILRSFGNCEIQRPGSVAWSRVPAGLDVWHPGDEIHAKWRGRGRFQFLFVAPGLVERVVEQVGGNSIGKGPRQPSSAHLIEPVFDALDADLAHGSPGGALAGDSMIVALLAQLAGVAQQRHCTLTVPARRRVIDYIDCNLARPLSLADLAGVAGIGIRQFGRAFRAATGKTPHQYLLDKRVERAKSLIARGLALCEIATMCGFSDQSQFSRTFSRRVGATPSQYRLSLLA